MTGDPKTFLLAESQFSLREGEASIIETGGYGKVLKAGTGTEAWSLLKQRGADFVVAAWQMPEMSGLALLKVIRADNTHYSTPVILVADEVTKAQVIEAGESGVSDILIRPFTEETFRRKIDVFLRSEQDPDHIEAERNFQEGVELMKQGRFAEALKSFRAIMTIYENAEIYYNMGYIKTAQGYYDEAIICFRRATQINNHFARAYQKMAECYLKLGQNHEAEMCFQRAAEIYMEKNMDDNAEVVLKEVARLNPDTINVYNSLGIIYRRQSRHGKAVAMYKRALKVSPSDENIYYNMARAFLELGDLDQAAVCFTRALKLNPGFIEAKEMLKNLERRLDSSALEGAQAILPSLQGLD